MNDKFELVTRHVIKDIKGFPGISMQFLFKNPDKFGNDSNTLIFVKKEKMFEFDYMSGTVKDIYTFEKPLNR